MEEFDRAVQRLQQWTPAFLSKAEAMAAEVRHAIAASGPPAGSPSKRANALFLWRDAEQELSEVTGAMRDIRAALEALPDQ